MNIRRSGLICVLCLVCLVPVRGSVEFPLIQSLTLFPMEPSLAPGPDDWAMVLTTRYSNIYAFEDTLFTVNDMEMLSLTLGLAHDIGGHISLEAYLRYQAVFGGFLDRTIETFHDLFSLPLARRDRFQQNRLHYWLEDRFQYRETTGVISPLVLSAVRRLRISRSLSARLRLFMGIPLVSKPGFVSDQVFWGPGIELGWQSGRWSARLEALISFFRHPGWLKMEEVAHRIAQLRLRVSLDAWSVGAALKTTPFPRGDLSHNAHQAFIAYRFSDRLELGIVEDLWLFDTTPDISFYMLITLR